MYGTLFSALTFSISGTNPTSVGHVSLSAELPPAEAASTGNTTATPKPEKAPLRRVQVVKGEPAKAEAASKGNTPATSKPEKAAPEAGEKAEPTAENKRVGAEQEAPPKAPEVIKASLESEKTDTKTKDGTFEGTKKINGKEYEFTIVRNGDVARVLWSLKSTEASECSNGICQREAGARILKGDITQNFASMISHIENNYLTTKVDDKKKDKEADKADDEKEEKTKGQRLLESIITSCEKSSKSESSQTECKVEKFLSYLNKKYDKDKKKLDITSEEALDFFNENIKSSLQNMLTHKFAVPRYAGNSVYNSIGFNLESSIELREEQADAQKQQNLAIKMIKNLIKNIGGKYNDIRKSAESLYEESMKEQSKNAISEYLNFKLFKSRNDSAGAYSSATNFTLNDQLLRSLDGNLYQGILSGLNDSRTLLGGGLYNDLVNDLRGDQGSLCVNYLMLTEQQTNLSNAATMCGTSANSIQNNIIGIDRNSILNRSASGFSNADRLGRGTVSNVRSGGAGNSFIRLENGSAQGGNSLSTGRSNNRLTPAIRGN